MGDIIIYNNITFTAFVIDNNGVDENVVMVKGIFDKMYEVEDFIRHEVAG